MGMGGKWNMWKKGMALLVCAAMAMTGLTPVLAAEQDTQIEETKQDTQIEETEQDAQLEAAEQDTQIEETEQDTQLEAVGQEKEIDQIEMAEYPREHYYQYMDTELSYEGMAVTITYTDGSQEILTYGQKSSQGDEIIVSTTFDFSDAWLNGSCWVDVGVGVKDGNEVRIKRHIVGQNGEAAYSVLYHSWESAIKNDLIAVAPLTYQKPCTVEDSFKKDDKVTAGVYEFTTASDDGRMLFLTSGAAQYSIYSKADMKKKADWSTQSEAQSNKLCRLEANTDYYLIVKPSQSTQDASCQFTAYSYAPADSMELVSPPDRQIFLTSEVDEFSLNGAQIKVHYENGYEETVPLSTSYRTAWGDTFDISINPEP
jgi:hypothetical protein